MPGFKPLIDHKRSIQPKACKWLTNLLKNQTIPHALLFVGIEGVGKRTFAMHFAMACNCKEHESSDVLKSDKSFSKKEIQTTFDPCGNCISCRKILSGNHPDIIYIKPSGLFIRIEQIRSLFHTLVMKPYEARFRMVIISDAQTMNPHASNALLKVLEEPPDGTTLILTAGQIADLPPTIVSRCQQIRFTPISAKALESLLVEEHEIDPAEAIAVSTMAHGSYIRALNMLEGNWANHKKWLIEEVAALSLRPASRSVSFLLAFAEKLSKDKEYLADALELIKSWIRDLIVYKYYAEKIINRDLADKIRYASQKSTVASLISKIEAVENAQKDIRANTNLRLTMEALAMRLAREP